MLVYGQSGTGKTTLWATFPKPILALVCSGGARPGELRSIDTPENRKAIAAKIIRRTSEVASLLAGADKYATIVLDHGSGLQDLTLKEILNISELPAQRGWGMASQQQWGQSSLMCKEIFRSLLSLPQHVVIVAQERTFGGGGDDAASDLIMPTVGAALTPSVTGWLNPACDYVVQTFKRPKMVKKAIKIGDKVSTISERGKGVEFCLRTEPHDVYQTKFRTVKGKPLPDVIVDPSYDKIAALLNT